MHASAHGVGERGLLGGGLRVVGCFGECSGVASIERARPNSEALVEFVGRQRDHASRIDAGEARLALEDFHLDPPSPALADDAALQRRSADRGASGVHPANAAKDDGVVARRKGAAVDRAIDGKRAIGLDAERRRRHASGRFVQGLTREDLPTQVGEDGQHQGEVHHAHHDARAAGHVRHRPLLRQKGPLRRGAAAVHEPCAEPDERPTWAQHAADAAQGVHRPPDLRAGLRPAWNPPLLQGARVDCADRHAHHHGLRVPRTASSSRPLDEDRVPGLGPGRHLWHHAAAAARRKPLPPRGRRRRPGSRRGQRL
mmetsp:Transcript_41455/g.117367  ORF Transcript_41455/g.117367 Transcript_41455/m.117367 type:complete len:313 (+) Transcript_41455:280-1218(+)